MKTQEKVMRTQENGHIYADVRKNMNSSIESVVNDYNLSKEEKVVKLFKLGLYPTDILDHIRVGLAEVYSILYLAKKEGKFNKKLTLCRAGARKARRSNNKKRGSLAKRERAAAKKQENPNKIKNMETEKIRIKPIKKIIVENLYPYDFLNYFYAKTFNLDIFLNIEECQDYNYLFNEIIKKWEEVDSCNDDEFKCKVYNFNHIFIHNTVSDRFIIYDYSKLLLTIDFRKEGSKEGSSTFAYQILSNLAPLMQPEKWRGLGGGNISFDGKIKKQFKIYVTF